MSPCDLSPILLYGANVLMVPMEQMVPMVPIVPMC